MTKKPKFPYEPPKITTPFGSESADSLPIAGISCALGRSADSCTLGDTATSCGDGIGVGDCSDGTTPTSGLCAVGESATTCSDGLSAPDCATGSRPTSSCSDGIPVGLP